uniref:Mediator of RNA polymerase II transcription subunit 25 n=1 Tax=Mycena chlorophos TaxID=658473 RepID=A0ABQ0LYE2_MYCCL|nr:predicted protein [Mycena chlorophos]
MFGVRQTSGPNARQFQTAFIIYGTQDTPILCRNFFVDLKVGLQHAYKGGIGATSNAGEMGMAALEGFVAALEMFDQFRDMQPTTPFMSHIFHFAAGLPDDLEHPQCNTQTALDQVTWGSLPDELKKRTIHFSSISTKPDLPRFAELHQAASPSPLPPWFQTLPRHKLLLAGFPAPPPQQLPPQPPQPVAPPKGVKRPAEQPPAVAQTSPEPNKRPRLSGPPPAVSPPKPMQSSPPLPPAPVVAPVPPRVVTPTVLPAPAPNPPQPPPAVPTAVQQISQLTPAQFQHLRGAYQSNTTAIANIEKQILKMQERGEVQQALAMQQQLMPKKVQLEKLRLLIHTYLTQQQRAAAQAALQNQNQQQQQQPPDMVPKIEDRPPDNNSMAVDPPVPPNPAGHVRSLSGSGQRNQITGNPAALLQMRKMMEQQERARAMGPTNPGAGSPAPQPVWQGTIVWSGLNPVGQPRTVVCHLQAGYGNNPNPGIDAKPETWPKQMSWTLVENPQLTLSDYATQRKPMLCMFMPNPAANFPPNEVAFKSLVSMLVTKKAHYTVSWILPGKSQQTVNMLVFSYRDVSLVGAVFPITGVPDYPVSEQQHTVAGSSNPNPPPMVPNPNPQPPMPMPTTSSPVPNQPPIGPPGGGVATLAPNGALNPQIAAGLRVQIQQFLGQHGIVLPLAFLNQFAPNQMLMSLFQMSKEQRTATLHKVGRAWQSKYQQMIALNRLKAQQQAQQQAQAAGSMVGAQPPPMMPQDFNTGGGGGGQQPQFGAAQMGMGGGAAAMSGGFMGSAPGGAGGGGYNISDPMAAAAANSGGAVSFQMMQNFMARGGGAVGAPDVGNGGM